MERTHHSDATLEDSDAVIPEHFSHRSKVQQMNNNIQFLVPVVHRTRI